MKIRLISILVCAALMLGVFALASCASAKDFLDKLRGETVTFRYRDEVVTRIEVVTNEAGEAVTDNEGSVVTVVIEIDVEEPTDKEGRPVNPDKPVTTPVTQPVTEKETKAPETSEPLNDDTLRFLRAAFEFIHAENHQRIGGWATPAPSLRDGYSGTEGSYDAAFRLLADAGLDYVITLEEWSSPSWSLESLSSARKAGMKLWYNCAGQETDYTIQRLRALLASGDADALEAVYLKDEPTIDDFGWLKEMSDAVKADLGENALPVFSNLLPTYAPQGVIGSDYRAYVQGYVDTVKPDRLMFDYYPYQGQKGDSLANYAANIAVAGEVAAKAGIDLYSFIQASMQGTALREPTIEELRAEINLNLALGVKGIAYFLACEHYEGWEYSSMIDAKGQTTPLYDKVKQINTELKGMNGVVTNYTFKGAVILNHSAMSRTIKNAGCKIELSKYGPLKSADVAGDKKAVIGCFSGYAGYDGFYVVNTDYKADTDVTLHFDGNRLYGIWGINGLGDVGAANDLTLHLAPGEAAFVIVSGIKK